MADLRESLTVAPPADLAFGSRTKTNRRGMVETLANLKRAAQTATRSGAASGS